MNGNDSFLVEILDVISSIPRTGVLHEHYHSIAKIIAKHKQFSQFFFLVKRSFSGWQFNESSFWVYSAGSFVENTILDGPIVEISVNESKILQDIYNNGKQSFNLSEYQKIKDKLYLSCYPGKLVDENLTGYCINDGKGGIAGYIFLSTIQDKIFSAADLKIIEKVLKSILVKIADSYAEKEQLKHSLSDIAGEFLKISEQSDINKNKETVKDDVLQTILDFSRKKMNAEKCALFLVDFQKRSLVLERISDIGRALKYEQVPHIPTYNLEKYNPANKGQGVTLWVLYRKQPFNARSYEELLYNSEGHHKGNWDNFIYGSSDNAREKFRCVYMTPLIAGDEAIGVLKYENRTVDSEYKYFDQADEREIDVVGEVITNVVLSQRIERNRYERALPRISKTLVNYFGQPEFYDKLLDECRLWLNADLCSLFLVSSDHKDLDLKSIVGISKEKAEKLKGFGYKNYQDSVGLTCMILKQNKSFNVRSFNDLIERSNGHHLGKWDHIVYDNIPMERFKSLYSIPLRIGEENIGVLKVENKNIQPFYFNDSDERLFDMIGRLIAIGVKYDNEQYLGLMLRGAEIGFLASGIAHEFNNFLQIFLSKTSLIYDQTREPETKIEIQKLNDQIKLASKVIDNFRQIRNRKNEIITFDVDEIIQQIIDVSSERFKKGNINFIRDKSEQNIMIKMNPAELQTLIINLLKNAADATDEKGGRKTVKLLITKKENDLLIEVEDSGKGIDPDAKPYISTPYFTTKSSGMGMGLFWVYQLVERNKGFITHERNEYGGTSFKIILPVIA